MADKTLEMVLLFDFFGDLLTDRQKQCFDLYYNDDLSLSEIAEIAGISRQGVRDTLVRAETVLRETEARTGLVKRFTELQKQIASVESSLDQLRLTKCSPEETALIKQISQKLQSLKG